MWLKYNFCYAHGYGPDEYARIMNMDDVDEMKQEIFGEGDGLRQPRFEIVKFLPDHVRREKIKETTATIGNIQRELERLKAEGLAAAIEGGQRLEAEEIQAMIDLFNKTHDWSIFENVQPIDVVNFLYPHVVKLIKGAE